MNITLITLPQLHAAKTILLYALSLDGGRNDFKMHSRELRRSIQTGGGEYLLSYHNHEQSQGLISLLNRLVSRANLIPHSNDNLFVGVWNAFALGESLTT